MSAWGNSWGSSWGNSWGQLAVQMPSVANIRQEILFNGIAQDVLCYPVHDMAFFREQDRASFLHDQRSVASFCGNQRHVNHETVVRNVDLIENSRDIPASTENKRAIIPPKPRETLFNDDGRGLSHEPME